MQQESYIDLLAAREPQYETTRHPVVWDADALWLPKQGSYNAHGTKHWDSQPERGTHTQIALVLMNARQLKSA
jgi:hypothetical protein